MEVFYKREDGTPVRGWAYYKPISMFAGRYFVDGVPLSNFEQITRLEWFEGDWKCWKLFVQ